MALFQNYYAKTLSGPKLCWHIIIVLISLSKIDTQLRERERCTSHAYAVAIILWPSEN